MSILNNDQVTAIRDRINGEAIAEAHYESESRRALRWLGELFQEIADAAGGTELRVCGAFDACVLDFEDKRVADSTRLYLVPTDGVKDVIPEVRVCVPHPDHASKKDFTVRISIEDIKLYPDEVNRSDIMDKFIKLVLPIHRAGATNHNPTTTKGGTV